MENPSVNDVIELGISTILRRLTAASIVGLIAGVAAVVAFGNAEAGVTALIVGGLVFVGAFVGTFIIGMMFQPAP